MTAPAGTETATTTTAEAAKGAGDGQTSTYTPPASQAEFDRIIQDRLARATAKFSDYDSLKSKAEKHDAMELELGSNADKAAAKAREEARAEVLAESTPRLVKAEFKAAAKGVLDKEQLDALLEDYNPSNYVDDKGEVDEEKIAARVAKFAPKAVTTTTTGQSRNLGQGIRTSVAAKPGDGARAALAARGIKVD